MCIRDRSSSHAIVVAGGSAEAKEIWYQPRRVYKDCSSDTDCIDRNYLNVDEFTGTFTKYISLNNADFAEFDVEFSGETLNGIVNPSSCVAMIDSDHLSDIQQHGYASISCI